MPLHVLQLGPVPPPEGGISRNMLAIRDELRSAGHRCSIIATSKSTVESPEPDIYHPRSKTALIGLLRKLDYDVLHLHIGGEVTKRLLALAFACTVFGGKRSVLTVHSGGYATTDAAKNAKPSSLAGRIFRRFSRIVAVNEDLADVFSRYGVADEKLSVVLPYSLKAPNENVSVPADLTSFYAQHSPLLLAVGGLEKDYDPLTQIAAMQDIVSDLPNAGLMIVGGGSMQTEVETAIQNSGCADNIYLAGNVDHAVTLHLMRDADIVLRTTLFDGDAISVREALFLGTPVIATDNGMRPEGVELIGVGDLSALVERVKAIAGREKPMKTPGQTDNRNIAEVLSIYDDLAG
ncbi:MAG: glycosyltransferase family 4 protein [Pyrinomonadaceae bacterium]